MDAPLAPLVPEERLDPIAVTRWLVRAAQEIELYAIGAEPTRIEGTPLRRLANTVRTALPHAAGHRTSGRIP